MRWLIQFFEKTGSLGSVIAALGCASCFPALGSLGAALGLGFLSRYEGVLINTLLPVFAWLALILQFLLFLSHRHWLRLGVGITGPILVLLSLYPWWQFSWSTNTFYAGLLAMLAVAVWDLAASLRAKRCTPKAVRPAA